jgi:hypothetical protein
MLTDNRQHFPAMLTILAISYHVRCTAAGCQRVARIVLRHVNAKGRLLSREELCSCHAWETRDRAEANGLTVHAQAERATWVNPPMSPESELQPVSMSAESLGKRPALASLSQRLLSQTLLNEDSKIVSQSSGAKHGE